MNLTRKIFLFAILTLYIACGNRTSHSLQNYFPFQLAGINGMYTITVPVEDKKVMDQYHKLFTSYGFSGNGYTWEALIKHILETKDKALYQQINFDSEAGSFYAWTTTKESQVQFAKLLAPIFAEEKQLRSLAEKFRPDEIDD
jgi:Immunity protein 51